MAVLSKVRVLSNERLELNDFLNVENLGTADWLAFIKRFMVGTSANGESGDSYIVQGFDLADPAALIETATTDISIQIAKAMLLFTEADSPGGFYVGADDAATESVTINLAATNYIQCALTTETATAANRAFWDEVNEEEFVSEIDTITRLKVEFSVSTSAFDSTKIPLMKITTSGGVIASITDCRPMLFRLGSGGTSPDSSNSYTFDNRDEALTVDSTDGDNPFIQGDKSITSLKEWMDAIMTRIKEISGLPYWFSEQTGPTLQYENLSNNVQITYDAAWTWDTVNLVVPALSIKFPFTSCQWTFAGDSIADAAIPDGCSFIFKFTIDEIIPNATLTFTNGSDIVATSIDVSDLYDAGYGTDHARYVKLVDDGIECYRKVVGSSPSGLTLESAYTGGASGEIRSGRAHRAYSGSYATPTTENQYEIINADAITPVPYNTNGKIWLARRASADVVVRAAATAI